MKSYSTAFAFRRALEDRLNAASKAEGVDLQRMRRQVNGVGFRISTFPF